MVMKRERPEEEPTTIPTLQTLALYHIVNQFLSDDAFSAYVATVQQDHIRELLHDMWKYKTAISTQRRLASVELVVRYVDTKSIAGCGIISKTNRTHTLPLVIDYPARKTLFDLALSKLSLQAKQSTQHRKARFVLY